MNAPEPIPIEVFSDYTCPWCYVGWARFERARRMLSDEHVVDVVWRPFEIHPEVPIEGMPVEELPYPPDVWTRMQAALREAAASEGLEVGNRPKVSNTHRALMAGAWAQAEHPARFAALHERLFTGYFAEGRDLGDPHVLDDLVREAGLDAAHFARALEEPRWEDELARTSAEARALGITGTPTWVFDRRFAVSGAQPPEVFEQALRAARDAREARSST